MANTDRVSRWRCACYAFVILAVWVFFSDNSIRRRLFSKMFPTIICGVPVYGATQGERETIRTALRGKALPLRYAIASVHVIDGPDDCPDVKPDHAAHCHDDGMVCVLRGHVNTHNLFHEAKHAFLDRLYGARTRYAEEWYALAGEWRGRPYCGVMTDYGYGNYEEDAAEFTGVCGDWLVSGSARADFNEKTEDSAFRWKLEHQHRWGELTDAQYRQLSSLPLFSE